MNIRTVIGWRSRLPEEQPVQERPSKKRGKPSKSPLTPEKMQQIAALRKQGKKFREIAAITGLSIATVWKNAPLA